MGIHPTAIIPTNLGLALNIRVKIAPTNFDTSRPKTD